MVGKIHSIQTLGTLDGPGLRTVIFTQGCPMQCAFCHSVDTTPFAGGVDISTEELLEKVLKNKPYWASYGGVTGEIKGGVTITGGEPTAQPIFVESVIKELKRNNVHIALDSCLFTNKESIDALAPYVDLWMVSIKHMDPDKHIEISGRPNKQIFENLEYLDTKIKFDKLDSKIRIRFVIVPELTDDEAHIKSLGSFISHLENLESIELLPYVTLGRYKWIEIFGSYKLDQYREASGEDVKRIKGYLDQFKFKILPE